MMNCPKCKRKMEKQPSKCLWVCFCGWTIDPFKIPMIYGKIPILSAEEDEDRIRDNMDRLIQKSTIAPNLVVELNKLEKLEVIDFYLSNTDDEKEIDSIIKKLFNLRDF